MTDVKDTATETNEIIDGSQALGAPALDGSVDALVANLRAAKEQLAELLGNGDKTDADANDEAPAADRSAA